LVGKRLGAGGEGAVYQDASRPDYVLKIMHTPTANSEAKARAMLASPPAAQVGQYQGQDLIQIAWPQELLSDDSGAYVGFSMRYLDMSKTVGLMVWMIPRERRLNQLSEDDRLRVHLAANLASVTDYVNQAGHALIDLKPLNVLAYRKDGYVCLVDCDGFCIQSNGVVFPASAYTPDYLAPEYQTASFRPDQCGEEQDRFALAVMVYELLDNGIHPFSGSDQTNPGESYILSTRIEEQRTFLDAGSGLQAHKSSHHRFMADDTLHLFLRAFTGTPEQRPSSGEWKAHLQDLAQFRMSQCLANPDHWGYGKGCPWCLSKPVQIPPPIRTGKGNVPKVLRTPASTWTASTTLPVYNSTTISPAGSFAGPGWSGAAPPPAVPSAGGASSTTTPVSPPAQLPTASKASKWKFSLRWLAVCGLLIAVLLVVVKRYRNEKAVEEDRQERALEDERMRQRDEADIRLFPLPLARTVGHYSQYSLVAVAFSPDSRLLASCRPDTAITLWDVATGNEVKTLDGETVGVASMAFSPDGRFLASTGGKNAPNTIKLFDITGGGKSRVVAGPQSSNAIQEARVTSVAFSPNGSILAFGNMDHTIELWDVSTGAEQRRLVGHYDWVTSVAFSHDGRMLASASGDHTVKLWDVATGNQVRTLGENHPNTRSHSVAFSPDGRLLASATSDSTIELWSLGEAAEPRTLTSTRKELGGLDVVAFSPDGRLLASGGYWPGLELWNVATGKELGHYGTSVLQVAFSPDGRMLASGQTGRVHLWNVTELP